MQQKSRRARVLRKRRRGREVGWWDDKKPAVSSSAADLVGYAPLSSSRTGEETRTPRTGAGEEPRLHTEEALGPVLAR